MVTAADDAPDLLGLGTLCAASDCACRDFLPFVCAGCSRSFCAEHRAPASHGCHVPEKLGRLVVACPVCARGVELPAGVRPTDEVGVSAVVDAHMRSAVGCFFFLGRTVFFFSRTDSARGAAARSATILPPSISSLSLFLSRSAPPRPALLAHTPHTRRATRPTTRASTPSPGAPRPGAGPP